MGMVPSFQAIIAEKLCTNRIKPLRHFFGGCLRERRKILRYTAFKVLPALAAKLRKQLCFFVIQLPVKMRRNLF